MIRMAPSIINGPAVIACSQDRESKPPASQNSISRTEFVSFSSTTIADINELKNADIATPASNNAGIDS